jgi:hypothetical protein
MLCGATIAIPFKVYAKGVEEAVDAGTNDPPPVVFVIFSALLTDITML